MIRFTYVRRKGTSLFPQKVEAIHAKLQRSEQLSLRLCDPLHLCVKQFSSSAVQHKTDQNISLPISIR